MAGTNNFQQWNPTAANQESDAAYTSDSLRSGGAGSGAIFPSVTANKLFFQVSTFVAAMAAAMAAKNYNVVDSNLINLQTALGNIVTKADTVQTLAANGYVKLPNGLIIQWGTANGGSAGVTVTYTLTPFPGAVFAVIVAPINYGTNATRNVVYLTAQTNANFSAKTDSSSCAFNWIAIGN